MSQKLQMVAMLTLEKAKKAIRLKEAVHEQQQQLQGVKGPIVVDKDRCTWRRGQRTKGRPSYKSSLRVVPAYL